MRIQRKMLVKNLLKQWVNAPDNIIYFLIVWNIFVLLRIFNQEYIIIPDFFSSEWMQNSVGWMIYSQTSFFSQVFWAFVLTTLIFKTFSCRFKLITQSYGLIIGSLAYIISSFYRWNFITGFIIVFVYIFCNILYMFYHHNILWGDDIISKYNTRINHTLVGFSFGYGIISLHFLPYQCVLLLILLHIGAGVLSYIGLSGISMFIFGWRNTE